MMKFLNCSRRNFRDSLKTFKFLNCSFKIFNFYIVFKEFKGGQSPLISLKFVFEFELVLEGLELD